MRWAPARAWCAAVALLGVEVAVSSNLAALAFAAGFVALPLGFLAFPALVALASASGVAAIALLGGGPLEIGAVAMFAACATGLSALRARHGLVHLRRRMAIDWNAMRANRFIEEFEQAGRGWFWETTGRGALSYVSDQLAADLKTPAAELIGKPFSELIGIDESSDGETSERTLGFHLSARLPFTDVTVRAKTAAEIWWSLSGTPSFDENGRFLGFRGIGSDLTQQRRSEQEINRLAKYDSLTGLPNRALMRRTLDEALQHKSGVGEGLRAVPDRSRPLQERQRHARPSGRRRAAEAGRAAAEHRDRRARPDRPARRRRVQGGASRRRTRQRSPSSPSG